MTWEHVRLKDLGTWFGGGTPSKSNADFWTGGEVPWLSPKDMGPEVLHSTIDHVTDAAVVGSSTKLVPAGSVAVVTRSGILERKIPVALVPFATTMNQDMRAVLPRDGIDPRWIAWGLRAHERRLLRETRKSGTTVASIEMPRFYDFKLPVPEFDEQRRIITVLEDHLSRIDAAGSGLHAAQSRLKAMAKSVLLDLIPDASAYPASWKRATVADAGFVELGRQRHPDWHNGPNMRPYLRVANVFEDRIDTSDVDEMHWPPGVFERYRLRPGDILLNEGQTPELVGRAAMYRGEPPEVAATKTLIRFRPSEHVLSEFALLVFRRHMHAGRFKREARITTNIAHLPVIRLKPIEFPIPPIDEQLRIITSAKERLDTVSVLRNELAKANKRSSGLRRALLAAAFSGRLSGGVPDMSTAAEMVDA